MSISAFFSKIIGFRTLPTTFVVVVLYLAIFISVFLTDEPAKVPKNLGGLSLQEAYADLRNVSQFPLEPNGISLLLDNCAPASLQFSCKRPRP